MRFLLSLLALLLPFVHGAANIELQVLGKCPQDTCSTDDAAINNAVVAGVEDAFVRYGVAIAAVSRGFPKHNRNLRDRELSGFSCAVCYDPTNPAYDSYTYLCYSWCGVSHRRLEVDFGDRTLEQAQGLSNAIGKYIQNNVPKWITGVVTVDECAACLSDANVFVNVTVAW